MERQGQGKPTWCWSGRFNHRTWSLLSVSLSTYVHGPPSFKGLIWLFLCPNFPEKSHLQTWPQLPTTKREGPIGIYAQVSFWGFDSYVQLPFQFLSVYKGLWPLADLILHISGPQAKECSIFWSIDLDPKSYHTISFFLVSHFPHTVCPECPPPWLLPQEVLPWWMAA